MTERVGSGATAGGSLVPPEGWASVRERGSGGCGAGYLVLVTALAALLRLWRLDGMSLWIDEVMTWNLVTPDHGLSFGEIMRLAYQGPLYPAVLWPLVRWHEADVVLRLPAALAGIAVVPLFGAFVARLWDRMAGRLAALLMALSPFAIWYAQEGRGYSFVILFAVLAGLVMQAAVRRGATLGRMLLLALLVAAGITSNNSFLILLVAFGLTVLVAARPRQAGQWLRWGIGLGGGVALASPWLLAAAGIWELGRVVPGVDTGEALRGDTTFSLWALPFSGHAFFYGFTLGPSLTELHAPDRLAMVREHAPLVAAGGLVAAAALLFGARRLGRSRAWLLLWIAVPIVVVVLLAARNVKPFNVRYLATAFPWVLAIAAAGIAGLPARGRGLLAGALCVLSLVSLGAYFHDARHAKEDVRGAVAAITAMPGSDRPLLVPAVGPVVRHYWRGTSPVIGLYGEPRPTDPAAADAIVARRLAGLDEAWIVWARTWDVDPRHLLPGALARAGTLERVHSGPQVAVDLWRRRPAAESAP